MKTKVGLWIDHSESIVVTIGDKGEDIKQIKSGVEKQPHHSGDLSLKGGHVLHAPGDNKKLKVFMEHIKQYYDKVIVAICDAENILIFGPGEAKYELKKELENHKLDGRIAGIEAADKMTEPQIVQKVHQYFKKK